MWMEQSLRGVWKNEQECVFHHRKVRAETFLPVYFVEKQNTEGQDELEILNYLKCFSQGLYRFTQCILLILQVNFVKDLNRESKYRIGSS